MTTRKALMVVGFLILLIGLSLVIPSRWLGSQPTTKRTPLILRSPEEFSSLSGDTNKNNTPDWRDLLLETVGEPLQEEMSKQTVTAEDKARLADPNNLTVSFSKNIYTASAYAKKNGTLTPEQQESLVASILEEEARKITITKYEMFNITIAKEDTLATKKAYGNALGRLLKRAEGYKVGINDLSIIEAFSINKDPAPLASFVVKKNNINIILEELLTMPVPYSASSHHLFLVNRLSEYKTLLENLSKADTDPVRATISLNNYISIVTALTSSFTLIQDYFELENITFTSNEPGYTITSRYTN